MFRFTHWLLICCSIVFIISSCSKDGNSKPGGTNTNGNGNGNGNNGTDTTHITPQADIVAVDSQVNVFMTAYNVPALSIAITKGEKLVYIKSYGLADKENSQKADTSDLYRLASLSKQFTSVAIMKLLEQGKISLGATVFGPGGLLGEKYGTLPYGPHITEITVDQLLHHTCGGWGNSVNDPMFSNNSLSTDELISWTLNNMPLDHTPGTYYNYSNFGYCLLGRIIEKITGQSYEAAVKTLVLTPIGITDMTIGGNTLADRLTKEVKYYGQYGEDPYNFNLKRMDSHGGWVATAKDLAKFLVSVDGFTVKPDILTKQSLTTMLTVSSSNSQYACGWAVSGANYYHQGSLPGSATEQACTSQGYNFVILTNTRYPTDQFETDLDQLFWRALAKNPTWADTDQFK
jgi:D-alanyl-D-alanine carboxypeptidase